MSLETHGVKVWVVFSSSALICFVPRSVSFGQVVHTFLGNFETLKPLERKFFILTSDT